MECIICNMEMKKIEGIFHCKSTGNPLSIYKCNNCGLISQDQIASDYFEKAYSGDETFNYDYYRNTKAIIMRNCERFRYIRRFIREDSLVLDYGAGMGYFVKVCTDRGIKADGIEKSIAAIKYADEMLKIKYIKEPSGKYNLITLWDTIEHLAHPVDTVNLLKDHLEGYLIIETANADTWKYNDSWSYLNIDHNYYFAVDTLKFMMEQLGFSFEGIINTRKYLKYLFPIINDSKKSLNIFIFKYHVDLNNIKNKTI